MNLIIRNGRVIDPATGRDGVETIYVKDDKISGQYADKYADRIVDAKGFYVMPGLIDLHVHLRDPGLTYKEDVNTGARAAARGGVTTIVAMPNTKPVMDRADRIAYVNNKAKATAAVNVIQTGSVTIGQEGKELVDIHAMAKVGVPALSEDGKSVMNALLMHQAMEIAAGEDKTRVSSMAAVSMPMRIQNSWDCPALPTVWKIQSQPEIFFWQLRRAADCICAMYPQRVRQRCYVWPRKKGTRYPVKSAHIIFP